MRASLPATDRNIDLVRQLILRYGWNATAYQIVNPGIEHWFSSAGDAVVGFVARHGVAVVAGAPICSEARLPLVVDEWERDAASAGNSVCYFGAAGRAYSELCGRGTYSSVILGAQPVWRPAEWKRSVAGHASLRAQFSRARNKGVVVEEWHAERATRNAELRRCLQAWLRTRGLPPLHFLVEPETLDFLDDRRIFVAERGGEVVGFLTLSPVPARSGWLTEQFPRTRLAPNGAVELLMDHAVRTVAREGAEYVTMGLVPLADRTWPPAPQEPLWLRLMLRWVRAHGRRFYNFQGLEAFKSKFGPAEWEPIYAISNEPSFSFRALYAIAAAFSGRSPILAVGQGIARALRQEIGWISKR